MASEYGEKFIDKTNCLHANKNEIKRQLSLRSWLVRKLARNWRYTLILHTGFKQLWPTSFLRVIFCTFTHIGNGLNASESPLRSLPIRQDTLVIRVAPTVALNKWVCTQIPDLCPQRWSMYFSSIPNNLCQCHRAQDFRLPIMTTHPALHTTSLNHSDSLLWLTLKTHIPLLVQDIDNDDRNQQDETWYI